MFKKLKEKIAEEVNASRLQEIINSAQAAVSSNNLSNESDSSSNFFSLNDENTPQNSPLKPAVTASSQSVDLYSPSTQNTTSSSSFNGIRMRKLSNSSVASDVFRLPAYDLESPIYHLQSDWESASEAEDNSTVGAQLDVINKEQIYNAYRNALDKYQKYRKKFSDLAVRYKSLEQDNAKARSVLVETQDKALRRISELREQCALSEQAKAHLESALRLEIEEREIVINTLQTKMKLLGESDSEKVLDLNRSSSPSLLNFSDGISTSKEQSDRFVALEKELEELRIKLANESSKSQFNENSLEEVRVQQAQLDTITADNTTIRSELTLIREKFIKQTREFEIMTMDKLKLEDRLKEVFDEKKKINSELTALKATIEKVSSKFKALSEEKVTLLSKNEQLNNDLKKTNDELEDLRHQKKLLIEEIKSIKIVNESSESNAIVSLQESIKSNAQLQLKMDEMTRDLNKVIEDKSAEIAKLCSTKNENAMKIAELEKENAHITLDRESCRAKIESLKSEKVNKIKDYEKTLEREIREKNEFKVQVTNIIQEIGRLEEQLKEVRLSHASIQSEKQKLEEKIGRIQRQHDEAKKQDKDQAQKWQAMIKDYETKLHDVQSENTQLSEQNCLLQEDSRRSADELKKIQSSFNGTHDMPTTRRELEDRIKTLSEQLTQCTSDHASLFDAKEQLDHQFRSLQDDNETKEKEKMCLIEDLKCVESKLAQLETEKSNLTECCSDLRVLVDNIKKENDAMIKTRDELKKSCENMTSEFNKINTIKQRCEQEMETLKNDNKSLERSLTDVENSLKQTHDEMEKKMEKEKASDEKIQELTRLILEKDVEVKTLKDLENAVSTTNMDLEQLNKDLLGKVTDLQRECQNLKEENKTAEAKTLEMREQIEKLNTEKCHFKKEIENNHIVIKDLNNDFETLNEEKAALIAKIENSSCQFFSEAEMGAKPLKYERYETLITDCEKLQEINKDLLVKLENLEKSSERKISDLSQEIENLLENSKHHAHVTAEYTEIKNNYELLKNSNQETHVDIYSIKTEKDELENRLKKIMDEVNEVSSKNLFLEQKVENFLILEESYERLKVSNEKLSRQLDETLVSMHHNEGENTEFEYLRNILFQYLSGHVNANGTTLVKVIAAVLKFSAAQTQLVLEKESQRHTVLGSINNLL